jgi:hypothetical protein
LQVGDTGPVESARRSNSRVLGSPFSGLSGHYGIKTIKNYSFINRLPLRLGLLSFSPLILPLRLRSSASTPPTRPPFILPLSDSSPLSFSPSDSAPSDSPLPTPPLCFYPSDSAPFRSPPLTPPPRLYPSESAPSASTPPTRPPLLLGLGTEFRSEKITRNRLGTVSVIPRKKVLIPRHSEFRGRANYEAERNGTEKISAGTAKIT